MMVGNILIPEKPPRYWVAAKRREGLSQPAFGRIWYHIYTPQKRLQAWLLAPTTEWGEHGMHKP